MSDVQINAEDLSKHVNVNDQENGINDSAIGNNHVSNRKIFIGGLNGETSVKDLREHFGSFGEIESINIKTDRHTGRSRGFGFIVFKDTDAIKKVYSAGDHVINNKTVYPQKVKPKQHPAKIFVGGLTNDITYDELRTYFSQFGKVVSVAMPFDVKKNHHKSYCFVEFDSDQVVNELLKTPKRKINGKDVFINHATPKQEKPMVMPIRGGFGGFAAQSPGPSAFSANGSVTSNNYDATAFFNVPRFGASAGVPGFGASGALSGFGASGGYSDGRVSGFGANGGYSGGKQQGTGRQQRYAPY